MTARRAGLEAELGSAIVGVVDALHTGLQVWIRSHDLTPPLAITLRMLREPRSMRELAEAHNCDASNITGIVDRLESRGLVERRSDPTDRRVTLVSLSPTGHELRRELPSIAVGSLPSLDGLDDDELATLISLLRRLTEAPPA